MLFNSKKSKFVNSVLSERLSVKGTSGVSKIKKDVKKATLKRFINFSESSNGKIVEIGHKCGSISYSYQRHDLEFNAKNWLKFLYNNDLKSAVSNGTFFSSGMGAISTLITVLIQNNFLNFVFTNIPYFESYDYITNYFPHAKAIEIKNYNNKQVDVLWIDSASPKFLETNYKEVDTKIIVCDTSCLDCSNDYIKELTEYTNNKNIPLCLVRSHMKLDCFGLEVNRLGSVVVVNDVNNLLEKVKTLKVYFGNNTTLNSIYPWLGYEEFFSLTTKDIKDTQDINNLIENELIEKLDKNKYEVVHFNHCLYFTIRLKQYEGDFNKLNSEVSRYCQSFNLPVSTASSFYLEKIGIDNFIRRLDNNSKFLRISSSFIKKEQAIEIAERIGEYLNNLNLV